MPGSLGDRCRGRRPTARQALQSGGEMRNEATIWPWCRRLAPGAAGGWPASRRAADAADLYRIQGVPVDAVGGERRRRARARDRQRPARGADPADAAADLARRHDRLPDVSTVPIERYVNSFEIAEEKVGPNQYLGVHQRQLHRGTGAGPAGQRRHPLRHAPLRPDPGRAGHRGRRRGRGLGRDQPLARRLVRGDRGRDDRGRGAAAGRSRRHRRRRRPASLLAGDPAVLEALGVRYGATTVIVATATGSRSGRWPGRSRIELRRGRRLERSRSFGRTVEVGAGSDADGRAEGRASIRRSWRSRTTGSGAPRPRRPGCPRCRRPSRLPTSRAGCR